MIASLENIHKSYASGFLMRRRHVLHGLSLTLQEGDAYGLLGHNGSGKSTTLRVLLGLSRPETGSGSMFGAPLGDRGVRGRLGYLPETPTFHEQLTSREFLMLCGELQGEHGAALGRRVQELLERLDLASARDLRLRKFSKGMLQRLGLAQALLGAPDLLVLDEPMSGLDPQGRKLVRDLILEQRAAGRTVLFSTHILSDVEMVCTRAGILSGGRLQREVRLDEVERLGAESVEVQASGLDAGAVQSLSARAHTTARTGSRLLFSVPPGPAVHELVQAILARGGNLESVTPRRVSLEDVFVSTVAPGAMPESAPPATAAAPPAAPVQVPAGRVEVGSR
jgi:ABC-2 type transport system ATP-binding protein